MLKQICNVRINLTFVPIPDDEDWGTVDSLIHIKEQNLVKVKTQI
jgi:hypothetical protein